MDWIVYVLVALSFILLGFAGGIGVAMLLFKRAEQKIENYYKNDGK